MRKRNKLIACIMACALALGLFADLTAEFTVLAESSAVVKTADSTEGSSVILENDTVSLQLVNNYSEAVITDKRNGNVWSSSMSDPDFDISALGNKWMQRMTSLFSVTATNLSSGYGAVSTMELLGTDYTAVEYETEDGFGVKYDITTYGFIICLEFSLVDDGITVRIPYDGIDEYDDTFSLVSVDLMTFFGACPDGSEGYFFYPDGSGAIMEFDDPAHYNESSVTYTIYGNPQNFEELQSRFDDADPTVLLPVFGGNYGENGFVAYITEGAESSKINVVPAGSTITANYMYPTFVYRRNFTDPRVSSRSVQTYSGAMLDTDYEICYRLLEEGEAEYADMASAYREYLIESEGMTAIEVSEDYALVLDLFMGIEEEGILFNTLQSMTTFSQAEEILEELVGEIDGELKVSLVGWTSDGYGCEPNYFPANSSLGGNSGLKSLANFAAENGIELSLAIDLLTVDADAGGYSTTNDIVYLGNYQALTNLTEDMYVISPNVAAENFSKFLKKACKYSLSGVKLENLGNLVLYNYRSRNMVTSEECVAYWQDIIETAKDSLGTVTVEGGNAYALSYADLVTDIPISDCGYQMTTKSVPFYQIVAHGYVEYTGDALNLSSDVDKQLLQWIEYGYLPYFELTYESPDNLIETDYSELFSSQYSAWKDTVVESYEELSSVLSSVRTAAIVSHEEVADDVFCTGYENGIRIYVNYNDNAVTADGVEIEGMSYLVVEGS